MTLQIRDVTIGRVPAYWMGAVVNIKEVADLAGVSQSTVSNVFVGRVPVREKTRQKVLAAAQQLGYSPNGPARFLRTGHSDMLGFCVTYLTHPTVAAIVHGASRQAFAAGYTLMVSTIEFDPILERAHVEALTRQRLAAILAYPAGDDAEPYRELLRARTPIVWIHSRPPGVTGDLILPDYYAGTLSAVRHLLATGRKRVSIFTVGTPTRLSNHPRLAAYRQAHEEMGLPVREELVRTRLTGSADAYETAREVVALGADAIIAASAPSTLGVLGYLWDAGLAVPGEVAVVGAGDQGWARLLRPPLTMVEMDGEEVGRRAVQTALERMRDPQYKSIPPRVVELPVRLVVRESSAPPCGGEESQSARPAAG